MSEKKYYWLKLHKDFFKQKEIKRLRRIAGGDVYTIIYLKMLLQSLETDGYLYYDGYYDSFIEELAADIDEEDENVKIVVAYLLEKGLMEVRDEVSYLLTKCSEMTGSESGSAERVRRHRQKVKSVTTSEQCNVKSLQCNTDVTDCNTEIEKDIEKEKKKDKDNKMSENEKDFEELWILYPRKEGKSNARKAYLKAVKHGVTKQQVETGIRNYVAFINAKNTSYEYIKHGSSWFNQECWNDDYRIEGGGNSGNIDTRNQRWNDSDPTVI